jgi:hypothetical protein
MALPVRTITDENDVPFPGDVVPFPGVERGVATPDPPVKVRIWNNLGGVAAVDDLVNAAVIAEARLAGSPDDPEPDGTTILDSGGLRIRTTLWADGVEAAVSDWFSLGLGQRFELPVLPGSIGGTWVETENQVLLPPDTDPAAVEVFWRIEEAVAGRVPDAATPNAVPRGVGDSRQSAIIFGAPLVLSATPFEVDVEVAESWYALGEGPYGQETGSLVFDATDGAGDPLAVGEAYVALVSYGRVEGFVITKGLKGTAPLAEADRPDVPAGQTVRAWVTVPEVGLIVEVDEPLTGKPAFFHPTVSGLDLEAGPGRAFVDGREVVHQTPTSLGPAPVSTTFAVYVQADRTFTVVDLGVDEPPTGRPLKLWQGTSDATDVVALAYVARIRCGGFSAAC